jgi:F0F1-type ATP synthase membrane subunit b/b'
MAIICLFITVVCVGLFVAAMIANKRLEKRVAERDAEAERLRQYYESESLRIQAEAQTALRTAQALVDQEAAEMKKESERVRQHYEAEALKTQAAAEALVAKTLKDLEPLRKYESLREPEAEAQRMLAEALAQANGLRQEAQTLLERARTTVADERAQALRRVKDLGEQADALLNQATRDAGRIVSDAEKRAEQIGGEAYLALRDKQLIEQAAAAVRNVVEGYGDRYIIPTRSLLDDLAAEFGHTAAGESLRAARDQSRRMVEQGEAATCDYVETSRRETAIRFVIDAFNGRVDAILSRVKHDNFGTLQQEIRDAFSLVNLNGKAFRDARILPVYLDARLAELKWAAVVQELRLKEREEQQRIREQMREEEKARREYERAMREAAMEQDMLRKAMEKAQQQVQQATAEQKAEYEAQLQGLAAKLKEAEERNQRAISMAQQTRRGHVYIISNVGSFGDQVYKIGLTRRLEPQDRVDELGGSSVPFEFDVHAMIFSEDAPALESQLHKHFIIMQMNKVNHRKEFFRVDLKHIREEIEKLGITPKWTMTAAAAEYRETQALENRMKDNPALRDAWVKRQLQMELLDRDLPESDDQAAADRLQEPAEVGN